MNITQALETMTPDEFAAKYAPAQDAPAVPADETPDDYFIVNKETGKLELHFQKSTYDALTDAQRKDVKANFLWGRHSGCWISRCKEPNLYFARKCAESLGLYDAGSEGERLSFAEQMERKAERAERRADRYEGRADAAATRAEHLQKPINDHHGDISFFTQPNINTSAGRAFTRQRERMWASFEQGFKEFNKSAYWKGRAASARATADQKELQSKGFVMRRIRERESDLRKLQKLVTLYEGYVATFEKGETPKDQYGSPVTITAERAQEWLEHYLERMEVKLDELGFYQDCLDKLGGVQYSPDNIKPGYIVRYRGNEGEVVSVGPKNCVIREVVGGTVFTPVVPYAEISAIVKAVEARDEKHPFRVGDEYTCHRWNSAKGNTDKLTFRIIKATDKSVTLQTGDEKPIIRKPTKVAWSSHEEWCLRITDWSDGIIRKRADENPAE
ncbi:MAG: DUF3560 domain-containing protein [Clostridia bacterium]|nr:DUF3560 domain-containing protein [Clostridia bacterium]